MTSVTALVKMHGDFALLLTRLETSGEASLRHAMGNYFPKVLLLTAASRFESEFTKTLLQEMEKVTTPGHPFMYFMRNTGIERRFHSWFDWNARNANQFFALFGSEFQACARSRVAENPRVGEGVRAFIEIGRERNRLVHQDFATHSMAKTMDDVLDLVRKATVFVEWFPVLLRDYMDLQAPTVE